MAAQIIPAVVGQYFATIRRMDPDAWVACFTEQATGYEPGAPAPLQGHAALRQFLAGVLTAFQAIDLREDHVFSSGNRVAVKFTGRGTGKNGTEGRLRRHRCVRDQPRRKNPNDVGLLGPSRDDGAVAGLMRVANICGIRR